MFSRVVSNFRKKRRKINENKEKDSSSSPRLFRSRKCVNYSNGSLSNIDCKSDFSCIDTDDDNKSGCDKGCLLLTKVVFYNCVNN